MSALKVVVHQLRQDDLRGVDKVLFTDSVAYGLVATIYFVKDQKPITVPQLIFWEFCRFFKYEIGDNI